MSSYTEVVPGMYALWRYDRYPYLLGGPVSHMNPEGAVYTTNYGRGYAFSPVKVMPLVHGLELELALDELGAEYKEAAQALRAAYDKKLATLLTPYCIELPQYAKS